MKYKQLANQIIANVGGSENIQSVTFCTTRLRFKLFNDESVNKESLNNVHGVLAVINQGGQTQVVIGQHVKEVYEPLVKELDKGTDIDFEDDNGNKVESSSNKYISASEKKEEMKEKKIQNGLFDIVSGVFTPLLGLLSGTGILKGMLVFLSAVGIINASSGTYQLLDAIASTFFTFIPVFLGYTSMKKFGGTGFIGLAIGAAFVAPTLSNIMQGDPSGYLFENTVFQMPIHTYFFGIPVTLIDYHSSVFPVILTTWFASYIEKILTAKLSDLIKFFAVPALTLLVSVLAGYLFIGPVATFLGNGLGAAMLWIYNLNPMIAGFLYGLLLQFLVIFGLHWGFIAISINNLATLGFDAITVPGMASVFGQAGVILYILLKTKDKKMKQVAGAGFISAMFGITEPGIYGVTLQNKRGFVLASIASGVAGGIMGYGRVKLFVYGPGGVFAPLQVIPDSGIDATLTYTVIACIVAFVLSFVLMHFFGKFDETEKIGETVK